LESGSSAFAVEVTSKPNEQAQSAKQLLKQIIETRAPPPGAEFGPSLPFTFVARSPRFYRPDNHDERRGLIGPYDSSSRIETR
jgi:hypothetical protein